MDERTLPKSEAIDMDGRTARTLSLEQLIAARRAARRPKDREHLVELEALLALRRESR